MYEYNLLIFLHVFLFLPFFIVIIKFLLMCRYLSECENDTLNHKISDAKLNERRYGVVPFQSMSYPCLVFSCDTC